MARGTPAKGNFASYRKGSGGGYPADEEATDEAIDYMFTMCGNPGQEAMIGDNLEAFYDWALAILESESDHRGSSWEEFKEMVINDWYDGRLDKWMGTDQIWGEGWKMIAEQSANHDAEDEMGEGTGQEFG